MMIWILGHQGKMAFAAHIIPHHPRYYIKKQLKRITTVVFNLQHIIKMQKYIIKMHILL